jgi:glycosyltransferase involved in cell wall biosynthesis
MMPSLRLDELPPPPAGKKGWPWTESPPTPGTLPKIVRDSVPSISIVTPSYNQAQFIEESIRSVLLQGYPNLEYLILDGGSCDGSVEIIRKYEEHLSFWVSERDNGQSDAINRGFCRCTGELMNWLNSDDVLVPGALLAVAEAARSEPEAGVYVGAAKRIDAQGRTLKERWPTLEQVNHPLDWNRNYFSQPAAFFRRAVWQAAGPLKVQLNFALDVDLWIRFAQHCRFTLVPQVLALDRDHAGAKTTAQRPAMYGELAWLQAQYGGAEIIRRDVTEVHEQLRSIFSSRIYRIFRSVEWMLPRRLGTLLRQQS